MSKTVKRAAFTAIAAFVLIAICFTFSCFAATEANAAENVSIRNKVYAKIEGVNTRGPGLAVLPTDSLELTVSVDVPSGRFVYFGFNGSNRGAGGPAAGATPGIGLLMYNSNNVCLALEVYRNDNWGQLTATIELPAIKPSDIVTLSIKNKNGVRGLYVNGELFTGAATGMGGTTAGTVINPLEFIPLDNYSENGNTYVEWGTWDGGGAATLYAQQLSGTLSVLDRDGMPVKGFTVDAAYDGYGNVLPLTESRLNGNEFIVSSLCGNLISSLQITTAGGVSAKAVIGEDTVISGADCFVTVKIGDEFLSGVEFDVFRKGVNVTDYIKVTENNGVYAFEDCRGSIEVTARRAGYESGSVTVSNTAPAELTLTEKAVALSFSLINEANGETVSGMAEKITVYRGDEKLNAPVLESSSGVYSITGFKGKTGDLSVRFAADGYAAAQAEINESYDGIPFNMYTAVKYTATVITDEGATVKAGDSEFTAAGNVYRLTDIYGDITVQVVKSGKATRYAYINSSARSVQLDLSDAFDLTLKLDGIADGTDITYTLDGVLSKTCKVKNGRAVIPGVGRGSVVTLEISGIILNTDTFTVSGREYTPDIKESTVTNIKFMYKGLPAADVTVNFGFAEYTADGKGIISISSFATEPLAIYAVTGYSDFDTAEIAQGGECTVNLYGKLYRAEIKVTDGGGNAVSDALVYLKNGEEEKKTYYNNGVYELGGLSGEYSVYVNGVMVGKVDENRANINYNISGKGENGCGAVISASGVISAAFLLLICSVAISVRRKSSDCDKR